MRKINFDPYVAYLISDIKSERMKAEDFTLLEFWEECEYYAEKFENSKYKNDNGQLWENVEEFVNNEY